MTARRVGSARMFGISVMLLTTGLNLLAFWAVDFLPIQDGPAHGWMVTAWSLLGDQDDVISGFVSENLSPAPNWIATLLLKALTSWVDLPTAQTALVSLVFVGFVASIWFALGAVDRKGRYLSILGVPFAAHWYLFRGSFNYAVGLVMLIVSIGFWLRFGFEPERRHFIGLSGLLLLTYLSHPVPFLAALAVVGMLTISSSLAVRRLKKGVGLGVRIRRLLLAATPAILLMFWFLTTSLQSGELLTLRLPNPIEWLRTRVTLVTVVESLDISERPWVVGLAVLLFGTIVWAVVSKARKQDWRWTDGLLAGFMLLTIGAYIAPQSGLGGTSVPDRIYLCAIVIAIIWIGTTGLSERIGAVVVVGGMAVTMGLLVTHVESYRVYEGQTNEIMQVASFADKGSTILPVVMWQYLEPPVFHRVMPPIYAGSYVAAQVEGVDLGNLDPGTKYHALIWRDDLDQRLYDWMARYGPGDITPSEPKGPPPPAGSIDYVLLIGPLDEGRLDPVLAKWLDDEYQEIYASQPEGIAHLYQSVDGGS